MSGAPDGALPTTVADPLPAPEPRTFDDVRAAARRLGDAIHRTPLLRSSFLDRALGGRVVFKAECFQKIGAFKARGALNALLHAKEDGRLPKRVVAESSGNHAQALAWSAARLGVHATICMPGFSSEIKRQATKSYGAEVRLSDTRSEAEAECKAIAALGATLVHPYDHDDILCGQGTATLEALEDGPRPDAIFAPCGGGGLLSGTFLAASGLAPDARVFGVEPEIADDAFRSYRDGRIHRFDESPETIADGVRTLSVSARTFAYIRQTAGIVRVDEPAILAWTQWLTHLLKATVEPTSALGAVAAARWLRDNPGATALVILSGGNLSRDTRARVWRDDAMAGLPS